MLDMVVKGEPINLDGYIMDKMLFTLRQNITYTKKMSFTHKRIIVPYVTLITRIAKSLVSGI